MCDPVTIAGAVLTGAGMAANSAAAGQVAKARNGAMQAERIRQQAYDQETAALNTQSQNRYQDFGGQQEQKAKSLGDYFNAQNTTAAPAAPDAPAATAPASSSNIVVAEQAKQGDKAHAYSQQQGNALGNLRSFGDLLGGIGLQQARDAGYIGQIGGFKKGSSGVLDFELDSANHKGDGTKQLGDILGGLGQIGLSAGLSKNIAPGLGKAAGAPTTLASAVPGSSVGASFGPLPFFAQNGNSLSLPRIY
jgi:hypothetical protein